MNRFLKILSVGILLVLCGWSNVKKDYLVVGTSADYPPFSFMQDKQIVGHDVDLAKEIAQRLGYKIYIKDMNFDELIPALQQGKIDFAIAAITSTPQRSQIVDFSSIKYYLPRFSLLHLQNAHITSLKSLENKKIAVQSSSTMESFLKEHYNVIDNLEIISFGRTSSIIHDLKEGLIDGIFIELAEAEVLSLGDKNLSYSVIDISSDDYNYAIAFPKGSSLIPKVNDIMVEFKISNKFDLLSDRWLNANLTYDIGGIND